MKGSELDKMRVESDLGGALFLKLESIYSEEVKRYTSLIDAVKKLKGSNGIFKESLNFNGSRISDFIVELIFAEYFCKEGFTVEFIPRVEKERTPDLFISKSELHGYVEIKHIHKKHDGPDVTVLKHFEENPEDEFLEVYGDHIRDERYCRDKILEGFQQIGQFSKPKASDAMIVAIWNSDEDLDERDMRFSKSHLIEEKNEFENFPNPKLIVYGSDWYSPREHSKFHVFRL